MVRCFSGWLVACLRVVVVGAGLGGTLSSCESAPAVGGAARALPAAAPLPAALRTVLQLNDGQGVNHALVVARLTALRPRWQHEPRYALPVAMRLAWEYGFLQQTDSAHHYRRLAEQQAARVARQLPLLAAIAASDLGNLYWQQQAYDSSRACYQRAVRRLTGYDTLSPATRQPTPGSLLVIGPTLAGHCANTGLSYERRGDLATAIRYYTRAARLYQLHTDASGLAWTYSLVASAYAAQGATEQAAAAYELALEAVRRYGQPTPGTVGSAARLFTETLYEYQPLLLQAGAGRHLAALLAEAQGMVAAAPLPPGDYERWGLLINRTMLTLGTAELQLFQGQPAAVALARADSLLGVVRQRAPAGLLAYRQVPSLRVRALLLKAWQMHTPGAAPAPQLRQAVALLDSIALPGERRTSQLRLAAKCLDLNAPALAIGLLRPLVNTYRQTRNRQHLRDTYACLARAYAATGALDSAYRYELRLRLLTDTLRSARQYAALTEVETRYRTREKEARIEQLTDRAGQERRITRWAVGGALLLTLLLAVAAAALRTTRRLNQRLRGLNGELAGQRNQIREQADALQVLDRAKSQFFANVSHELRTPLTLVLGPLEQVLAGPDVPAAARAPLLVAARHGQRLRELVNRILDFTKLQAGKLAVQAAPTALATLVSRLSGQFSSLAAQQRVHLVRSGEFAAELVVSVDADKIEQIITNLIANALTHTPPGGRVVVGSERLGPARYAISVRDTGPGIAPAEQERIFERFYQSPQKQAQGGTGLGLALSRELAELLGGALTLRSEEGQGATFTLAFPAEQLPDATVPLPPVLPEYPVSAPAPAETETGTSAPGPRPRVLVVEDHADLRTYLRGLLEPAYEVLEAEDGQAALEVLATGPTVDLITTDAMMPRVSGTELLERLKADPATASLPVLMLTARADDAHRLAALEVGVDDYLTKPFRAAELLVRVRALLARYQTRQQYAALPAGELLPPTSAEPPGEAPPPDEPPGALPDGPPGAGLPEGADGLLPPSAEQLRAWRAVVAPRLPDEAFGPDELALALHLSRRSLYRRLHELTGLTPAAWLRELRLDLARRLLEDRVYPTIAEVAYASGFSSPSHFGKVFLERFGCRPSEYGH